jgi:hypothetical protein
MRPEADIVPMSALGAADHLASAPMSRAPRAVILSMGIGLATVGGGAIASATTPPAPPPVPTTVPDAAIPAATTEVLPPPGTRGDATDGSVAKPQGETWSARRIATMTGLAVVALAAAGYAYGKLRSAPPRHPDLAPRPPHLDGADPVEATS